MPALMLTKADEKALPALYSQENAEDPIVKVKWFSIVSDWRWYACEAERTEDGDVRFFGLVTSPAVGPAGELGYWTLSELQSARRGRLPLIEKDQWFDPTPLSKIRSGEVY